MTTSDLSRPRPARIRWPGLIKKLGPGLPISAIIVGSGELIVTPKPGYAAGFARLRFIILGCFINVLGQAHV